MLSRIGLFQVVKLYHHVLVHKGVFKWSENCVDSGGGFSEIGIVACQPKSVVDMFKVSFP